MQYFGIPTCPYCKKTVNIIRVWNIKKSGEFMCPRCKGISNVYLSPLIYVLAVISVAAGFLIYFFDRFIWATTSLMSPIKVLIPFVIFFVLSLFMVYFKKPIIRKVRKTKDGRFFDQNGNELKMRMGKLVPVSSVVKEAAKVNKQQNSYNYDDFGNVDISNFKIDTKNSTKEMEKETLENDFETFDKNLDDIDVDLNIDEVLDDIEIDSKNEKEEINLQDLDDELDLFK